MDFSEGRKSLTESINEKLLDMASRTPASERSSVSPESKHHSSGNKRSFEEISVSRSWAKLYDKDIPESLLEQCRDEACNICQVDMTSSVQGRQHYQGAKHEKKVRLMLSKMFPQAADTPKRRKFERITSGDTAAELFLKKIESEVERDPSRMTYGDMKLDSWQKEWLLHWDSPLPPPIISLCRLTKCDICDVTFSSVVMARSHFDGKNHDKKLRAALELYCGHHSLRLPRKHEDSGPEFERFCQVCEVELTSDSMARTHFAGKKHVDKQLKFMSGRASTSAVSDPTGRFSFGGGFVKNFEVRDFTKDEDEDLKKSLERATPEGNLDGTWGGGDGPVPLMSLQVPLPSSVPHAFDNKSEWFYCPLCDVKLESRVVYDQHVAGKAHRKKQEGLGGPEVTACEVCNISLTSRAVYEDHVRGKQHQKKLAVCGGEEGELSCAVCLVQCCSQAQLDSHLAGKTHQRKVASRSQGAGGFRCSVCKISTTDQNGLTQHLNGKAHQAMLRRRRLLI